VLCFYTVTLSFIFEKRTSNNEEVKDTLETAGFMEIKLVLSGKEMDFLVEATKPNQK